MSTHDAQTNPLLTHRAIAAMAVALPLLTLPGTALALEEPTVDSVVSEVIASTGGTNQTTEEAGSASAASSQEAEVDRSSTAGLSETAADESSPTENGDAERAQPTSGDYDFEKEPDPASETIHAQSEDVQHVTLVAAVETPAAKQATSASASTLTAASVDAISEASSGSEMAYVPVRAEIANGLYEIAPGYNIARRVDVQGGSTASGANVQLYTSNLTAAQIWRFTKNTDGTYSIVNIKSGLALAVASGKVGANADVRQVATSSSKAQRWIIEWADAAQTTLTFRSALNSAYVLEIAGGSSSNGTNVRVNRADASKGQGFSLVSTRPVSNGVYVLTNGSGKVLDVSGGSLSNGGNIQQYTQNNSMTQYFYLQYNTSTGYYTITNVQSGRVLDVKGGKNANRINVQQYRYNGSPAQQWMIRERNDGNGYTIYSAIGSRALDVFGGSSINSANVQIYSSNNSKAQRWTLSTPLAAGTWLSGKTYQVVMANNTANSLTVSGRSINNSAQAVTGATTSNGTFGKWQVVWNNGYIRLIDIATGKALDVSGGKTTRGTKVQQYSYNGSKAQLWLPVMTQTGIKLQSALASNIVLDVSGGSTAAGAKLQTYTSNNSYAQRFIFKSTSLVDSGYVYTLRVDMDGTGSSVDYALDVPSASMQAGTAIQTYTSNGSNAQQYLVYSENGGYRVQNINSGLYLTSAKGSSRVTQTSATDASTLWTFVFSSKTNSVNIVSQQTALAITTARPSSATVTASAAQPTGAGQGFLLTPYSGYMRGNTHGRLSGIDISSWNAGINLSKVACDFVIIKATQGTTYVNPYMKEQVASAIGAGKLIGFYHFADTSKGAANEARFFYNTVKPYIGQAVLVYDWENNDISGQNNLSRGPSYAKTFLDTVYSLSHVKPMIYMSRSVTTAYNWSSVANAGYELWMAQYLNKYYYTTVRNHVNNPTLNPGGFGAWSKPAIYQYTSTGVLSGYSGKLDLNVFYGNRADWMILASKR